MTILLVGATGTVGTLRGAGLPAWIVDAVIATSALAQRGLFEATDEVPRAILHRRGHALERWIERHRAAFG